MSMEEFPSIIFYYYCLTKSYDNIKKEVDISNEINKYLHANPIIHAFIQKAKKQRESQYLQYS